MRDTEVAAVSDRARVSSSAFAHDVPHGRADAHAKHPQPTVQRLRKPHRQSHHEAAMVVLPNAAQIHRR